MPGLVLGAAGSYVGEHEVGSGALPRIGTLALALADVTVDIDGVVLVQAVAVPTLDTIQADLDATVLVVGSTVRTLDDLTPDLDGTVLVVGSLVQTLDGLAVDLDTAVLVQATLVRTLDGIILVGAGTVAITGSLVRTLDGIGLVAQGTVQSSGPVTGTLVVVLDALTLAAAGFAFTPPVQTVTPGAPGEHREWHTGTKRRPSEARRHPWVVNAIDRTGKPARTPWRGPNFRDRYIP